MSNSTRLAAACCALFAAPLALADSAAVPDALKPWSAWALRNTPDLACPQLLGQGRAADDGEGVGSATCVWPSRLEVSLTADGGKFSQQFQAFTPSRVDLPGEPSRWPQDVRIDGKPAPTLPRDATPTVFLGAGEHVVTGTFVWKALPESLRTPPSTALLALTLAGRPVASPSRDASGLVWLQRDSAATAEESRFDVTVHRHIADEVPLLATTRIKLDVSGKSREVLLAKALLPGFVPISISGGGLPARLEPDGRLRVQVLPGTWTIDVVARHEGPTTSLTLPKPDGPWAANEVWVFDARPELRVANIEGVPPVDPQQTSLPDDWRQFLAYRVAPGDTMTITEIRRGDADPAPDQLSLRRQLWLDFDGSGYTARDQMSGTLSRSWRLSMPAESSSGARTVLGRVSVDNRDQLVTKLADSAPAGVEIRQGVVNLTADSRIEGSRAKLPAVGWDLDFHSVSGTLQLPPGWRLLHASGVDEVPATWVHRWTLLDIFLVLIVAVAVARLYGTRWGVATAAALMLTFPEPGAPQWLWLFPLAFEALTRVIGPGRLSIALRTARSIAWIVLVLTIIPFAVQHVRVAMYPTLERSYGSVNDGSATGNLDFETAEEEGKFAGFAAADQAPAAPSQEGLGGFMERKTNRIQRKLSLDNIASENAGSSGYTQRLDLVQNDPNSVAQTGPGLPAWNWQSIDLRWSGPVEHSQVLKLYLVPPWLNLVLAFLRVALVAGLLLLLVRGARGPAAPPTPSTPIAPAVIALLVVLFASNAQAQIVPSPELLEELRTELSKAPECAPNCASSPRLAIEASGTTLRIRQEIGAIVTTGVPLPGGLDHWTPERVLVDGAPAKALRRGDDGNLWIALAPGVHQVILEGSLAGRDSVPIPLPLKPFRVETKAEGWTVDGVREDGAAEQTLQLSRVRRNGEEKKGSLEAGVLPPFVRVERALLLGLDWTIETRVTRLTPSGTPVVLEVPLVKGEAVISADVRAENGRAIVNMGPRVNELSWKSVLARQEKISLEAPSGVAWTEVWRLEVTPVWHFEAEGIPAVHQEPEGRSRIPEWRPWPGEKLALTITPPTPVAGQTLTIQSSQLSVTPGLRSSDGSLTLVISSSRGEPHTVSLPEGAQLQSVTIDGRTQPLRQVGATVTFPLKPGSQTVALAWRQPLGITGLFRTPPLDLGSPSVNAKVDVQLSTDRWILFAGGPPIGPAVLFWSLLVILVVVAVFLGRLRMTPLRTLHWILLGLGLTQVPIAAAAFVAVWLIALGYRREKGQQIASAPLFDLMQLALAGATIAALVVLFLSIKQGLLGHPDMQIEGNGSSSVLLRWFQDRTANRLPSAWVLSVPRLVYRALMLVWALWLALSLVSWLRWGWQSFSTGGAWRRPPPPPPRASPKPPPLPPTST